ncbi:hypothetical protein L204_104162 [Cryptococcus depauperatus]
MGTLTLTSRPSSPEKFNVILPEDIWRKIISVIDSPSTLCALARTCRAMSSLSSPFLWYRVSVGLHHKSSMKIGYIGSTRAWIKPLALPLLTAGLRRQTRIMDFYFECLEWTLSRYRRKHHYLALFVNVKVVRIHLESMCGPMFPYTVRELWRRREDAYNEKYARTLPPCEKMVYVGPCNPSSCFSNYGIWFASWGSSDMSCRVPKKLVIVLKANSYDIDFTFNPLTLSVISMCQIQDLHDIVIIFYQGKDRRKHLSAIMNTPWRNFLEELVIVLKITRKRHTRTRITLVNTGCFEARWLGFNEPVKEQLVQQRVNEELKTEGLSRWGMEFFERFPEHVTHSYENEDVDKTKSLELNAGKEKERLLSMSEYLQTEDWEGELEESEVKQWLDGLS